MVLVQTTYSELNGLIKSASYHSACDVDFKKKLVCILQERKKLARGVTRIRAKVEKLDYCFTSSIHIS